MLQFSAPVGKTIYYLCDVLCCIYILLEQIVQREKLDLQHELDSLTYLWKKQKDQYAVTQETIEIINRKCHDLKHQIHAILNTGAQKDRDDYLKEIDKAVEIYDTAVSTGNTALDTVLMEKGLCCRMHDIQWTCMVDGACLDNIDPADLYAMFGNALDNAITAVMPIQDVNKRIISVTQSIQGDLSVVQVRNYYEGALCFENGLPRTSRQNREKHGYGMKSMRYTAEKYGGSINVDGSGQIFTLSILLPMSHRKERAS